jgi:hypothetical protein
MKQKKPHSTGMKRFQLVTKNTCLEQTPKGERQHAYKQHPSSHT